MPKLLKKELYPIGTVVILEGGNKPIMIYGRKAPLTEGDKTVIHDYVACLFPEGYLLKSLSYFFNHGRIEKVLHMGLVNDAEKAHKLELLSN